jgi:RNA polymerase sigma factor (sigma-70 family)
VRAAPDERLAARVRAGDESAFEAIYDRYHRELLAFCRHMLGSREEAEDVLQHVMVAAHRQLESGADLALRPWLYAVARNRCISVLRSRREAASLEAVPEPTSEGLAVAATVEQREDLRAILSDVARLPDDQRAALLLAELGALSHDEIADALEVRRDKVKALVFQAREALAGWHTARDANCADIRAELANASGGALRRGPLRKHLEVCDGCSAFSAEVKRQRAAIAMLLPVLPTFALKGKVLGAAAATGTAAAAGTGAGVGGAIGVGQATLAAGGVTAGGAGGLAAKVLVVAAVAGAAGGGYAVVDQVTGGGKDRSPLVRDVGLSDAGAAAQARDVVILPASAAATQAGAPARAGETALVLLGARDLSAAWAPQTLVPPSAVLAVDPTVTAATAEQISGSTDTASPSQGATHRNPRAPAHGVNGTAPGQVKRGDGAKAKAKGKEAHPAGGTAGGHRDKAAKSKPAKKGGGSAPPATSNAGGKGNGNGPSATSKTGGKTASGSEPASTAPGKAETEPETSTGASGSGADGTGEVTGDGPPANSNAGGKGNGRKSDSGDKLPSTSSGKSKSTGTADSEGGTLDEVVSAVTGG